MEPALDLYNFPPGDNRLALGHDNDQALFFGPSFWTHLPGADGTHLVTITGGIKYEFMGYDDSALTNEWRKWPVQLHLPFPTVIFPPATPGHVWQFRIDRAAPFFSMNGVDKGHDNHTGGWAVYQFGTGDGCGPGGTIGGTMRIRTEIWARGALFNLFRVGYSVTVSGVLINVPIPPPE